jgi:GTPase
MNTNIKNHPPEDDNGNIEYKVIFSPKDNERKEKILSQMSYRIAEGNGEAFYKIGLDDDGTSIGITEKEYNDVIVLFEELTKKRNFSFKLISEEKVTEERKVYEFLVREKINKYSNTKIVCMGNVDSGKSTLLGVLLSGENDDGRGRSRVNVFNFKHEMKSGKTSSVAQHILGYDVTGKVVNYTENDEKSFKKSWNEIVNNSSKIITFFDLCGHEKYLKTTISGISSNFPDISFILIGANMGLNKMTKEHIFLTLALQIPFVIIITKIDICEDRKNVYEETRNKIKSVIKNSGINRNAYDVKNEEDVIFSSKNLNNFSIVPIFHVSNVTGKGINLLKTFLNIYTPVPKIIKNNVEFHVDNKFYVSGVGIVLGGQLISGKIKVGDKLNIGPYNNNFYPLSVKSIHCKRVNVEEVESGNYVCLAVKKLTDNIKIRKGQVIINTDCYQVKEFEGEITVLKSHSTTIKVGYQPVFHTRSIRQTVIIKEINDKKSYSGNEEKDEKDSVILRTGDRAKVKFSFIYRPEYVDIGYRFILAEGSVKIIGKITNVEKQNC